ncbi:MAG: hypothetical protein AB7Q01_12000 [Gammaproteobacteria bacterium]
MIRHAAFAALTLLGLSTAAGAQEVGGVRLAPGAAGGPSGLAQPLPVTWRPLVTAQEMQAGTTAAGRQARHQNLIGKLRGDAGYLGGFSFGTPLAPSRQPVPADDGLGFGDGLAEYYGFGGGGGRRPVVINKGPVAITIGNDNVIQQQTADSLGPAAQQQVATVGNKTVRGGGATNVIAGDGTILQQSPR